MACNRNDQFDALLAHARVVVEAGARELREAGDSAWRPRASRWGAPELLCHLWDSVQVNHQRTLAALDQEELVFGGYPQDRWVDAQAPATLDWPLLVEGWRTATLRLLALAERLDPDLRCAARSRHNLDVIGWQPHPAELPASLDDLLRDFVGHLFHHVRQLSPRLLPPLALPPGLGRVELPVRTLRLTLRALEDGDLDALAAWMADPEVVRYLPGPPATREQSARILAAFRDQHRRDGFSAWAVVEDATGTVVGWCGLAEFDNTADVELLYCFSRAAWGRGLASEAARACERLAREVLGLPRLIAAVVPENLASVRVLEKAGLTRWKPGRWFGLELDMYKVDYR